MQQQVLPWLVQVPEIAWLVQRKMLAWLIWAGAINLKDGEEVLLLL